MQRLHKAAAAKTLEEGQRIILGLRITSSTGLVVSMLCTCEERPMSQ
jgi:hypothetical protein